MLYLSAALHIRPSLVPQYRIVKLACAHTACSRQGDNYVEAGGDFAETGSEPVLTQSAAQRVLRAGHTDAVWRVLAVENRVFSASRDGTVRCWSGASLRCCAVLTGHTDEVLELAVHHQRRSDGDSHDALFTSSADGTCRMWYLPTVPDACAADLDPLGAADVHADAVADARERIMHFCVAGEPLLTARGRECTLL